MTKQIFPSTIMGSSFAEGGSVLDHNFGAGEPYTLGVEEEYMLLDGETLDSSSTSRPCSPRPKATSWSSASTRS